MMRNFLLLIIALILTGCNKSKVKEVVHERFADSSRAVVFAKGFSLRSEGANTVVTVRNPWQHAQQIEFKYLLSDTLKASKVINEYSWRIKTPVQKVICLSTTHIGFIEFISQTGSVAGISGRDYIVNDKLRQAMMAGQVFDVGYDESLDIELILKLAPDVVFAYGVSASVTNTVNKLAELGIPVILIGEYLENDPLAKMEWVKVFAACYGQNEEANRKFAAVVKHYNELAVLAAGAEYKPRVLLGLPWRGSWYISGSQSYIARLIMDAGGKYIWDNLDFNESRPMGLEMIYENALTAEFWINPGEAESKKDIVSVDERLGALPPMSNNKVFNNNNVVVAAGNAFFESGVVEPDIILSDLLSILHPQLLPSHKLKYYRKLQ
jgi:iron complex transport system substrate-binding protein